MCLLVSQQTDFDRRKPTKLEKVSESDCEGIGRDRQATTKHSSRLTVQVSPRCLLGSKKVSPAVGFGGERPSAYDLGGILVASEKWALGARRSALGWGKLLWALGSLKIFSFFSLASRKYFLHLF